MNISKGISVFVLFVATAMISIGCGSGGPKDRPDLGYVDGTVTMDGKPLPKARITFAPVLKDKEKSAFATAITDAKGYFVLSYAGTTPGAKLGENRVTITTEREISADEGPDNPGPPETIPARYNTEAATNADMGKDVKKGNNTFDFKLEK